VTNIYYWKLSRGNSVAAVAALVTSVRENGETELRRLKPFWTCRAYVVAKATTHKDS